MTLEVGMILYCESRWPSGYSKHIVDRVTAKRAYSGDTEFEREQQRDHFHARGSHGWDVAWYYIETPEWKSKYYRDSLERKFGTIDPKELPLERLEEIILVAFPTQRAIK